MLYTEGVRITEPVRDATYPARGDSNSPGRWHADTVRLADPRENARRIAGAVDVVRRSDVAVVVVGDDAQTSREAWSRGQEGGTAVADVPFGDVNPGGKLPVSLARSVGHLPVFYNHKPSARRGDLFDRTDALFPFGHGLSYTTFRVGAPQLEGPTVSAERLAAGLPAPLVGVITDTDVGASTGGAVRRRPRPQHPDRPADDALGAADRHRPPGPCAAPRDARRGEPRRRRPARYGAPKMTT